MKRGSISDQLKLPNQIAYLAKPILHLSRQDPEMLGCGGADSTMLDSAMRKTANANVKYNFVADADALAAWLQGQGAIDSRIIGAAAFTESYLRGAELFGFDAGETAPPKRAMGLQRSSLSVPEGMKSKLWASGLEIWNRDVQIIISEEDEASYDLRTKAMLQAADSGWAPHMKQEVGPFQIPTASGYKGVYRNVQSGLAIMTQFFLSFPFGKMEISMFSKNKLGSNIEKYEGLLLQIGPSGNDVG